MERNFVAKCMCVYVCLFASSHLDKAVQIELIIKRNTLPSIPSFDLQFAKDAVGRI